MKTKGVLFPNNHLLDAEGWPCTATETREWNESFSICPPEYPHPEIIAAVAKADGPLTYDPNWRLGMPLTAAENVHFVEQQLKGYDEWLARAATGKSDAEDTEWFQNNYTVEGIAQWTGYPVSLIKKIKAAVKKGHLVRGDRQGFQGLNSRDYGEGKVEGFEIFNNLEAQMKKEDSKAPRL